MTAAEYISAGYNISLQLSQALIDRAEADVKQAYITPLTEAYDTPLAQAAMMNLVELYCLQHSLFATRAGAKEKTTPQSQTPSRWDLLAQSSAVCSMKLNALAAAAGVKRWQVQVTDICGILFRTNYLSL